MGGENKTRGKGESRPLTPQERSDLFGRGLANIISANEKNRGSSLWQSPKFVKGVTPAAAERFSKGDYNVLESNIINSVLAPLKRQEKVWRQNLDEQLNKRGIYSSGAAVQAQNDITERLAPIYSQAGSRAARQRYGLQAQEMSDINRLALERARLANIEAGRETGFNAEQAFKQFQAKWRPLDYLQGLWNQTGGQVSLNTNTGSGWKI